MKENKSNIGIKFDGSNLGEGIIGVYDLANTILAFSQIIDIITVKEQLNRKGKMQINVNALRPGSFDVQMAVEFSQDVNNAIIGSIPLFGILTSQNAAEYVVKIFQEILRVKKFLKGKKPQSMTINQTGDNNVAVIVNFEGNSTNTTMPVIGMIQDKRTVQSLKKMIEPITKEGSNVDEISFNASDSGIFEKVTNREVDYFESEEDFQVIPQYALKGTVSAFDRKTGTGRLSVSESKRISFDLSFDQAIDAIEGNVLRLIESMKLKVPVVIKGDATLDYESNVKKIIVQSVDPEARLFGSVE